MARGAWKVVDRPIGSPTSTRGSFRDWGTLQNLDDNLEKALWAISRLGEDLPLVEGSESLRSLSWEPVLRGDGALIRLRIYFAVEGESVIELLSIRSENI